MRISLGTAWDFFGKNVAPCTCKYRRNPLDFCVVTQLSILASSVCTRVLFTILANENAIAVYYRG